MVGPGERNGMERVKPMSSYQLSWQTSVEKMFLLGLWRGFHFMIEAVISRVTVTVRAPSQKSNTPHSPRKVMIRVHRITPRVKARPHRPHHTSHSPRSCHPYERLHGQDLQPKVAHHLPPDTRAATPHFYPYIRWLAAEWRSTQPATSRAPEGEKKLSLLVFLSHFPGNLLFGSHFFPEKRKKMFIESFKVESPNVKYTENEIHSVYDYETTELVHENRNGTYQWVVKPKTVKYEFRTDAHVPKLGLAS